VRRANGPRLSAYLAAHARDELPPARDEARDAVGPLAAALAADGRRAPVLSGLAAVVSGEREAGEWAGELTRPGRGVRPAAAKAA